MLFHSQLTGHQICQVILSLLWVMLFHEQILLRKPVIKMSDVEDLLYQFQLGQIVLVLEVPWISSEADKLLLGEVDSMMLLIVQDQ